MDFIFPGAIGVTQWGDIVAFDPVSCGDVTVGHYRPNQYGFTVRRM
ncbi:MAG: hypothetical protein ABJA81_07260 [Nocardioidaceae bacterium]